MTDRLRDMTLYECPECGRLFFPTGVEDQDGPPECGHGSLFSDGDEPEARLVPAVVGITVKQVAFERRATDKMRRERDEARAEAGEWDEARERAVIERDEARAEAEKLRETLAGVAAIAAALDSDDNDKRTLGEAVFDALDGGGDGD